MIQPVTMRSFGIYLGLFLLLAPTWVACYWALGDYHPTYGLMLGLTSVFWGTASLIGWGIYMMSVKRKLLGIGNSLLLLIFNIMALSLGGDYESLKREKHFAVHKVELESVANDILLNKIDTKQANTILKTKGILFTAVACTPSDKYEEAFFYASGALDSQLGYAYQKRTTPISTCYDVRRWRQVAPNWWFGVR
ncbi:hypothetical protein JAO73_04365 [Hymenobacter sp. BT523]|uniref:hypothetical protein n=1 Tax=Hymenobacter sp. BT523 TaxID=2795725 RepID=UPI0018EC1F7C|nr:hypothetical protein [Hymenobacter sp. BT523]MBJ6108231.1 hypothetical protein [Hymenobacter sp. BT523]